MTSRLCSNLVNLPPFLSGFIGETFVNQRHDFVKQLTRDKHQHIHHGMRNSGEIGATD
jgi:hypothetical protein